MARANPDDWTQVGAAGIDPRKEVQINSMAVVGGNLVIGTLDDLYKGQIFQFTPTGWMHIGHGETEQQVNISSLIDFQGMVCAGASGEFLSAGDSHGYPGCEVYLLTGADPMKPWVTIASSGFGDPNNRGVCAMCVYNSKLYAGTYNENGCEVWCYDGRQWTQVNTDGFGDKNNKNAQAMAIYNSKLYVGTSGALVWCFDGSNWTQANKETLGNKDFPTSVESMAVYGSKLYAGTFGPQSPASDSPVKPGCAVWRYDGKEWTQVAKEGFGNGNNSAASSMASCESRLFVGTYNQEGGCEIWGYDTRKWTKVNNSGFGTGQTKASAMCVKDDMLYVGTWGLMGFGAQVLRKSPGAAPKPPTRQCATGSIGVTEPNQNWYIAEGASAGGFETWILIQNPGSEPADVTLSYQTDQGEKAGPTFTLPPKSRESINVGDTVETYKVSTTVTSTKPVISERAVYFTPE